MGKSKTVSDYMRDISKIKVTTENSMIDVIKTIVEQNTPAVIVTDASRELEGIITATDVIYELEKDIKSSKIRDGQARHVMTPKPISLPEGSLMLEAMELMERRRLHTLVIRREFVPVGILTQMDIVRWWLEEHGQNAQEG